MLYKRTIVLRFDRDQLVTDRDKGSLLDSRKYSEKVEKLMRKEDVE